MLGYEKIEELVVGRFIKEFDGLLTEELCSRGDLDELFENLQKLGKSEGVLLEFGGGRKLRAAPFNGKAWEWTTDGFYLIKFDGDSSAIEQRARQVADKLCTVLDASKTLGGSVAKIEVVTIEKPEPAKINEVPFYWIPMSIATLERI
jgi:hypothetical protein